MHPKSVNFVAGFVQELHRIHPEISAEQLLDILNLVWSMGPSTENSKPAVEKGDQIEPKDEGKDWLANDSTGDGSNEEVAPPNKIGAAETEDTDGSNKSQTDDTDASHDLFMGPQVVDEDETVLQVPASIVHVPAGRPLSNTLPLGRSLRPLHRKVPSRHHRKLDIDGTIERTVSMAMAKVHGVTPVFQPEPRRWLNLDIVIDAAATMVSWDETIEELRALLLRTNNFASIRTWSLQTDLPPGYRPVLLSRPGRGHEARVISPLELTRTPGERLIIVLTDCKGQSWYDGSAFQLLAAWGTQVSVTLLQILPSSLWRMTAMPLVDTVVWGDSPGIPNRKLPRKTTVPAKEKPFWHTEKVVDESAATQSAAPELADQPKPTIVPIPVTILDAQSMGAWSRMVAGRLGAPVPALKLEYDPSVFRLDEQDGYLASAVVPSEPKAAQQPPAPQEKLAEPTDETKAEILVARAGGFSPDSRRLRDYLSLWNGLTLPFIRAVRDATLAAADEAEIAEVLMSGLLKVRDRDAALPRYFWEPGVQKLLRSRLRDGEIDRILRESTTWFGDRAGSARDTLGLTPNADGTDNLLLDEDSLPIARVTAHILSQMGPLLRKKGLALQKRIEAYDGPTIPAGLSLGEVFYLDTGLSQHFVWSLSSGEYSVTSAQDENATEAENTDGVITRLSWSPGEGTFLIAGSDRHRFDFWHQISKEHDAINSYLNAPFGFHSNGNTGFILSPHEELYTWDLSKRSLLKSNIESVNTKGELIMAATNARHGVFTLASLFGLLTILDEAFHFVRKVQLESQNLDELASSIVVTHVLDWSLDGAFLALGQSTGRIGFVSQKDFLNASSDKSSKVLKTKYSESLTSHSGGITSLAFSPKRAILTAGTADGKIAVFEGRTSHDGIPLDAPTFLSGTHQGAVKSLTFSPDESLLITQGEDNSIRFWRCDDWSLVAHWNRPELPARTSGLAWHPTENKLAVVGPDGRNVQIWHVDINRMLPIPVNIEKQPIPPDTGGQVHAIVVGIEREDSVRPPGETLAATLGYVQTLIKRGVSPANINLFLDPAPDPNTRSLLYKLSVRWQRANISAMRSAFNKFTARSNTSTPVKGGTVLFFWTGSEFRDKDEQFLLSSDFYIHHSCIGLSSYLQVIKRAAVFGLPYQLFFIDVYDMAVIEPFNVLPYKTNTEAPCKQHVICSETSEAPHIRDVEKLPSFSQSLTQFLDSTSTWPPSIKELESNLRSAMAPRKLALGNSYRLSSYDPQQRGLDDRNILWVDDYPSNNKQALIDFNAYKAEVTTCLSTDDALQLLANHHFDAVITDLGRKENGVENPFAGFLLIESLRVAKHTLPVILIAGERGLSYQREAMELGCNQVTGIMDTLAPTLDEWLAIPSTIPQPDIAAIPHMPAPEPIRARLKATLLRQGTPPHSIARLMEAPTSQEWSRVWSQANNLADLASLLVTLTQCITECDYIQVFERIEGRSSDWELQVISKIIAPGKVDYRSMPIMGLIGSSFTSREIVWEPDVEASRIYIPEEPSTIAELCIPLLRRSDGEAWGVLNVECSALTMLFDEVKDWLCALMMSHSLRRHVEHILTSRRNSRNSTLGSISEVFEAVHSQYSKNPATFVERSREMVNPMNALPLARAAHFAAWNQRIDNTSVRDELLKLAIDLTHIAEDVDGLLEIVEQMSRLSTDWFNASLMRRAGSVFLQMRRPYLTIEESSPTVVLSCPSELFPWFHKELTPRLSTSGVSIWWFERDEKSSNYFESSIWNYLLTCKHHLVVASPGIDKSINGIGVNFELGYSAGLGNENKVTFLELGDFRNPFESKAILPFTDQVFETSMRQLLQKIGSTESVDSAGFLTARGIQGYVAADIHSKTGSSIAPDELKTFLLLHADMQRTWLVRSGDQIYCLLDDDNTRVDRQLIQLVQSIGKTLFISTYRNYFTGTRTVDLGFGDNWFYSEELYPTPDDLEEAINAFLQVNGLS